MNIQVYTYIIQHTLCWWIKKTTVPTTSSKIHPSMINKLNENQEQKSVIDFCSHFSSLHHQLLVKKINELLIKKNQTSRKKQKWSSTMNFFVIQILSISHGCSSVIIIDIFIHINLFQNINLCFNNFCFL